MCAVSAYSWGRAMPRLDERIVPLAALAADPAMMRVGRVVDPAPHDHGFMHDIVSSSGTPSAAPRRTTSAFPSRVRRVDRRDRAPSRAKAPAPAPTRNSGVASGNGLCASVPRTRRPMPAAAQYTPALPSSTMFRPGRIDVFVGRVVAGGVPARPSASLVTSRMSTTSVTSRRPRRQTLRAPSGARPLRAPSLPTPGPR